MARMACLFALCRLAAAQWLYLPRRMRIVSICCTRLARVSVMGTPWHTFSTSTFTVLTALTLDGLRMASFGTTRGTELATSKRRFRSTPNTSHTRDTRATSHTRATANMRHTSLTNHLLNQKSPSRLLDGRRGVKAERDLSEAFGQICANGANEVCVVESGMVRQLFHSRR